jgi:hypothetical protein
VLAEVRSKSRLKLVRHCVARLVSATLLPGKKVFVPASYSRCGGSCSRRCPSPGTGVPRRRRGCAHRPSIARIRERVRYCPRAPRAPGRGRAEPPPRWRV